MVSKFLMWVSCFPLCPWLFLLLSLFFAFCQDLSPSRILAKNRRLCHLKDHLMLLPQGKLAVQSKHGFTWISGASFKWPAVVGPKVQWDGPGYGLWKQPKLGRLTLLISGVLHWDFCWYLSCLSVCILTILWMNYRPKKMGKLSSALQEFSHLGSAP